MHCASIMPVEERMFSLDPAIKIKAFADYDQLADLIARLGSPLVATCGCMPPEARPLGAGRTEGGSRGFGGAEAPPFQEPAKHPLVVRNPG